MSTEYRYDLPDQDAFYRLFETTGWNEDYQVNRDELFQALKNSWYTLSAYENEKLVGFGRLVCDGVLHAVLFDVIIHPDFQNRGKKIAHDLVIKCIAHKIRDIQLFCAKGKIGFYEKCGFVKRPHNGPGMEIKMKYPRS
jgi:ribosomal protein S18 acetylase RimI-like enzyme